MSSLEMLFREGKPASKRWSVVYIAATVGGYLLSNYATSVADKLAPPKATETLDGSMTAADEKRDTRAEFGLTPDPDDTDGAGATVSPLRFTDTSLDIETPRDYIPDDLDD